ncbi:MAG: tRNA dihydrouridine synthase DusB [Pseudomonadota bacterium]|nr:tRNA dihydrouridine synthase DusB [Pseudomonadota bacterium]
MNSSFRIGPHVIQGKAVLAPMAGLTDQAFRNLCRNFGAAMAISEMNTANINLWNSQKSKTKLKLEGENGLKIIQIAGSDPEMMAKAANSAERLGADIIDINMGCPTKKVCRKLSGSALLRNEPLVEKILNRTVKATKLPVTLKMRTGWSQKNRNGKKVAIIAESAGIKALSIHGRTRECGFKGVAEFETIRNIKRAISIPVIANGDIRTVQKAQDVLNFTGADAVMIGRGALGQPWIFSELNHCLGLSYSNDLTGSQKVDSNLRRDTILMHLIALHNLYGEERGVRVARKHLSWYCKHIENTEAFWKRIIRTKYAADQLTIIRNFFDSKNLSNLKPVLA